MKENTDAKKTLDANLILIEIELQKIVAWIAEEKHCENPDWGNAGSAGHILQELREITSFIG